MIDRVKYRLLLDLFGKLSDRREVFSQLGRDGITLRAASWLYYGLSGLMVVLFLATRMPLATYFFTFLAMTAFLLFSLLVSETSNSLVNPIEGLILSHQPINGATYTAAKLTHLLRILVVLTPGLNLIPALAGLMLAGCPWYYPFLHMAAAFGVGIVLALFCCALFGWLLRFVPPRRLKEAGFLAEMSPWGLYMYFQLSAGARSRMHIPHWLPAGARSRMELAVSACALAALAIGLGIRSLSGDYLVRVAAIAHGRGSKSKGKAGRKLWFFGGPTVRAGYDYVSHMMMRDWQFRRQLLPLIPMLGMLVGAAYRGMRASPFSGKFTMMHVLPHLFGFAFFIVCTVMVYGSDHKGSWLFLLAPAGAFHGFARGVYARLLSVLIAAHAILLPVLSWYWGIRDAGLFIAYSAALASVYLGLELRLIDGMPFSKQPERTQNPVVLPTLMLGGLVIALVVAIQHYFIFRSVIAVVCITPALCGVAWLVTRQSLEAFEISIRFHLGLLSNESQGIYTEVEA